MSELDPTTTTVRDICSAAIRESGALGTGQTALAEDINAVWARMQWMLQQWQRKRFLVYHLVTYLLPSTGAQFYTIGPGGNINTDVASDQWNAQFGPQFGSGAAAGQQSRKSSRPDKLESAFLRQITQSQPNQIDYPLGMLHAREDYNRIALKQLVSFPGWYFYDAAWPLGLLYPWPVPQANNYALGVTFKEQLPVSFPNLSITLTLPYEYYAALLYNLALRARAYYAFPTYPGDMLPGLAKDSLAVLRGANAAIAQLSIPADLSRPGIYNVFSDQSY